MYIADSYSVFYIEFFIKDTDNCTYLFFEVGVYI